MLRVTRRACFAAGRCSRARPPCRQKKRQLKGSFDSRLPARQVAHTRANARSDDEDAMNAPAEMDAQDVSVDVLVDAEETTIPERSLNRMVEELEREGPRLVRYAFAKVKTQPRWRRLADKEMVLSVVLGDDTYVRELNKTWRGKDATTDVLSFEMQEDESMDADLPVVMLGDIVISVDTARRQARERMDKYGAKYQWFEEARVLLVHGLLHLLGYDHERGAEAEREMAEEEARLLRRMKWRGDGLIEDVGGAWHKTHGALVSKEALTDESFQAAPTLEEDMRLVNERDKALRAEPQPFRPDMQYPPDTELDEHDEHATTWNDEDDDEDDDEDEDDDAEYDYANQLEDDDEDLLELDEEVDMGKVKLVCIDLDGTLLDSQSRIRPRTANVVKEAAALPDLTIVLATGKARPAALAVCQEVGLAGPKGIVSESGPGVFLQGLVTYDLAGNLIAGPYLKREVVQAVFEYAEKNGITCVAFLGDICVTTRETRYTEELHERYREPKAEVQPLSTILGLKIYKLLLMDHERAMRQKIIPAIDTSLQDFPSAAWTQAVPTMVEVLPDGVDKWHGIQQLMAEMDIPREQVVAVGDGANDYGMLEGAGIGVAMENAVPEVQGVADLMTETNDREGVAAVLEAIMQERGDLDSDDEEEEEEDDEDERKGRKGAADTDVKSGLRKFGRSPEDMEEEMMRKWLQEDEGEELDDLDAAEEHDIAGFKASLPKPAHSPLDDPEDEEWKAWLDQDDSDDDDDDDDIDDIAPDVTNEELRDVIQQMYQKGDTRMDGTIQDGEDDEEDDFPMDWKEFMEQEDRVEEERRALLSGQKPGEQPTRRKGRRKPQREVSWSDDDDSDEDKDESDEDVIDTTIAAEPPRNERPPMRTSKFRPRNKFRPRP